MKNTCNVTNKSAGVVSYTIPDMHLTRIYEANETKKNITVQELESVSQQAGGRMLLYNYLMVDDPDIANYLFNDVAPEYWLKEADIPNWIESCSVDEFKDALDFAPLGIKDLIKKYAVSLPLKNFDKREAIKIQLGFDVTKAIELTQEDQKTTDTTATKTAATGNAGRRTASTVAAPKKAEETKPVKETKKEG